MKYKVRIMLYTDFVRGEVRNSIGDLVFVIEDDRTLNSFLWLVTRLQRFLVLHNHWQMQDFHYAHPPADIPKLRGTLAWTAA